VQVFSGDDQLCRVVVEPERPPGWTPDLVRAYRRQHQAMVAARDREDLRVLISMDYRTEPASGPDACSVRLAHPTRLLLDFDRECDDQVTVQGVFTSETLEVAR
jgi:plasmid maintenance system killer protein